jgi:hypothetical protein
MSILIGVGKELSRSGVTEDTALFFDLVESDSEISVRWHPHELLD